MPKDVDDTGTFCLSFSRSNLKKWKYLAENKLTVDQLPANQLDDKLAIEYSEQVSEEKELTDKNENECSEESNNHAKNEDEAVSGEGGGIINEENKSESSIVVHSDNDNLTELSHD